MPTITVSQEVYDRLAARAAARGATIEDEIALEAPPVLPTNASELKLDNWKQEFTAWQAEVAARAASYPPGFECDASREGMYEGCGR